MTSSDVFQLFADADVGPAVRLMPCTRMSIQGSDLKLEQSKVIFRELEQPTSRKGKTVLDTSTLYSVLNSLYGGQSTNVIV